MQELMEDWRQFLQEDLARLRFDHFTGPTETPGGEEFRVKEKPEEHIEYIRNTQQWKLLKRKLVRLYKKSYARELKDSGMSDEQIRNTIQGDNFQEILEKYVDYIESGADKNRGVVWADPRKFYKKVVGVSKTPKFLQKMQTNFLDKTEKFLERMLDKIGFDFLHDPRSTSGHEAIHYHLREIQNAYGDKVYRQLLNQLMSIFGKGEKNSPYEAIQRYFLERDHYNKADEWTLAEETLAWGRQFLSDQKKRKKFKKVLSKFYSDTDIMGKLKKAWRRAVRFAQNVKPEHLE